MKNFFWAIGALVVIGLIAFAASSLSPTPQDPSPAASGESTLQVTPIAHATMVLTWDDMVIYTDPVGDANLFASRPPADLVLVTDIHPDHLSTSTLSAVVGTTTALVVPQAVKDQLSSALAARATVLPNGESTMVSNLKILAVPMYNLPESADARHTKGRGNGYVLEHDGYRVYIAGDTAGTSEMRALTDIDVAFVPMNLPFTMSVDEAADAVLDFAPTRVYPYHYRGQDGLADVEKFKQLINAANPDIEVVLLNWYPQ